jgi:hypothetical protein
MKREQRGRCCLSCQQNGYAGRRYRCVKYLMGAGFVNGRSLVVDGGASKVKNES